MDFGVGVASQPEGGVGVDVVGWRGCTLMGGERPTSFPLDRTPAPSGLTHTQRRPCTLPFGGPDLGGPGYRLAHLWLGRGGRALGPFVREFGLPRDNWRRCGRGRPWGGGRWIVALPSGHYPGR